MDDLADGLLFARDDEGVGGRRQLARSAQRRDAHRVSRGVYLPGATWQSLDERRAYLAKVLAIAETRRHRPVLSHWSAAAVHGLPCFGGWPSEVHISASQKSGTHSRNGVRIHTARVPGEDIIEIAGILVTSLARTVIDLAATASFTAAIVAADRALLVDRYGRRPPLVTPADLDSTWQRALPMRAHARTRAVLAFAESGAESPLESLSRVNMRVIGVPRPRLQVPHFDERGFIGAPDFTWDEHGIVGEADGDVKYLDSAYRSGRSADRVVLDEKIREDRLRALPRVVSRWRWEVALRPAQLRERLAAAGLPTGVKW